MNLRHHSTKIHLMTIKPPLNHQGDLPAEPSAKQREAVTAGESWAEPGAVLYMFQLGKHEKVGKI